MLLYELFYWSQAIFVIVFQNNYNSCCCIVVVDCWFTTSAICVTFEETIWYFFLSFFSVRHLSVLRGHSVFSSLPQRPMNSDYEGFLYQILSITFFNFHNSWERASIFPFFNVECQKRELLVPFLLTSLVWRGPWLGIEPGTICVTLEETRWYCWMWYFVFSLSRWNLQYVG